MLLFAVLLINAYAYTEGDDYDMLGKKPNDKPFEYGKILYERSKCTTCCRVILASDWDYTDSAPFTEARYKAGHEIFVMDPEFDDKNKVRSITSTDYAQAIMLRPLKQGRELQFWELGAYKMINSYTIPKRNQDTRNGPYKDRHTKLIYWLHQPPLSYLSDAQKFYYVYPYPESYYPYFTYDKIQNRNEFENKQWKISHWQIYPKHMYVIKTRDGSELCYQAGIHTRNETYRNIYGWNSFEAWSPAFKNFHPVSTMYQIQIEQCYNDKEYANYKDYFGKRIDVSYVRRQEFTPVFA